MKKSAVFVVSLGALLGCGQTQLPPTPQAASLKTEDAEIEIIGLREWTLVLRPISNGPCHSCLRSGTSDETRVC
jgi:hypothetical protein